MSLERHQTAIERLTDVFRALGDPVRVGIMARIVGVNELACTSLEHALPVSKSTISYHVKVLFHAGLINVRKAGRNYFYSARTEAIEEVLPGLLDRLKEFPVESPTPV